ncbi:PREDICTED: polycomb group RING finger protein 3 [Condylura cristata]|uniref:polycomb group RING finger protein 3 n=1 Tax=Condylura cristata TaxID=143302 RepID=UPI000643C900|nr:PREDICTED: polycomb group RING finger protein 3 [Condylura cristata]
MLTRKIKLWDINAHITCRLCSGYLIDATTVTECLHTFCRSCLVKYLEENNTCPTCRIVIHQSHPLQYIGHDRTMQDIVYKLVPGLQEGETKADDSASKEAAEEKQEDDNDYHRSDEQVSAPAPLRLLSRSGGVQASAPKRRGAEPHPGLGTAPVRRWELRAGWAVVRAPDVRRGRAVGPLHLSPRGQQPPGVAQVTLSASDRRRCPSASVAAWNILSPVVRRAGAGGRGGCPPTGPTQKTQKAENQNQRLYVHHALHCRATVRLGQGSLPLLESRARPPRPPDCAPGLCPVCRAAPASSFVKSEATAFPGAGGHGGPLTRLLSRQLDILCNEEILGKDHTLKFVVVTRWRFKKAPLLLHYRPKMDLL